MTLARWSLLLIMVISFGCKKEEKGAGSSVDSSTDRKSGTVNLSWDHPHERVNGERLYPYEIGGYEIVYQRSDGNPDDWSSVVLFDDQSFVLDKHVIEGLAPGEYVFAISTFDIDGLYSEFSEAQFVNVK
jgi:hypothetical protein